MWSTIFEIFKIDGEIAKFLHENLSNKSKLT